MVIQIRTISKKERKIKMLKQTTSIIRFKYGRIKIIPCSYKDKNQVEVHLSKVDDNAIEVVYSFDDADLSKDQAIEYTVRATDMIALKNSLKTGVNSECNYNVKLHWQENDKASILGKLSVTAHAAVVSQINCELAGCLNIDIENPQDSMDHKQSLECFNKALQHKEAGQQDKSTIAIWLRLSWEALQLELGLSEQQLKIKIVRDNILSDKILGDFKYSVGEYYVHKKRKSGGSKMPISIEDCVNDMRKVLLHYI